MKSHIKLEGMAFYSHHGYYIHEQQRGNNYVLDVTIHYDMDAAAENDDLEQSINYEIVYKICREEMDDPRHLIESVVQRLTKRLFNEFDLATQVDVRLEKFKPELGGPVAKAVAFYSCGG